MQDRAPSFLHADGADTDVLLWQAFDNEPMQRDRLWERSGVARKSVAITCPVESTLASAMPMLASAVPREVLLPSNCYRGKGTKRIQCDQRDDILDSFNYGQLRHSAVVDEEEPLRLGSRVRSTVERMQQAV